MIRPRVVLDVAPPSCDMAAVFADSTFSLAAVVAAELQDVRTLCESFPSINFVPSVPLHRRPAVGTARASKKDDAEECEQDLHH